MPCKLFSVKGRASGL